MWTFTTRCQFVMNISKQYPMTNWLINKPSIWKRFIKRSVAASIYRNFKTWAAVDTPITLHPHKNHQLHWTVMTISALICQHPSRQLICRILLQKLFIAFRDNLLGKFHTHWSTTYLLLIIQSCFSAYLNRELSFKKGDIIYIRRQIDKNWYEGEVNAKFGLLPVQYVDVSSSHCSHSKLFKNALILDYFKWWHTSSHNYC